MLKKRFNCKNFLRDFVQDVTVTFHKKSFYFLYGFSSISGHRLSRPNAS